MRDRSRFFFTHSGPVNELPTTMGVLSTILVYLVVLLCLGIVLLLLWGLFSVVVWLWGGL